MSLIKILSPTSKSATSNSNTFGRFSAVVLTLILLLWYTNTPLFLRPFGVPTTLIGTW